MKRAIGICFLQQVGDMVASWVACKSLKQLYPEVKIDVLIPEGRRGLYALNNYVDQVYTFKAHRRGIANALDEMKYLRKLAQNDYDLAFQMDYKEATIAKILTLLTRKRGVNYKILRSNPLEMYPANFNTVAGNLRTQMYLDNLRAAGLPVDYSCRLDIQAKQEWIKSAVRIFDIDSSMRNAVYCPYAAVGGKIMKESSCQKLLEYLYGKFDRIFVMDSSRERIDNLINTTKTSDKAQSCYNLEFSTMAGLLKAVDFMLTIDTGPMHIADALDVPLVGMYGDDDLQFAHWKVFGTQSTALKSDVLGGGHYEFRAELAISAIEKKCNDLGF